MKSLLLLSLIYITTFISFTNQTERFFPDKHNSISTPTFSRELLEEERNLNSNTTILQNNSLITTLRLKGSSSLGYYFATFFFGTPLQRQTLIVDTGSSLTAIPCSDCGENCGEYHFNPAFNETNSSTDQDFACSETFDAYICSDCLNQCPFTLAYMEGSSYHGHYKKDLIFFGNEIEDYDFVMKYPNPLNPEINQTRINQLLQTQKVFAPFGCIDQETGLFYSQSADGILGLGAETNTTENPPNFLDVLEMESPNNSKAFSLCLAQTGGYFSIGGYNFTSHNPGEEIYYTNYDPNSFQYQVLLNMILVEDENLGLFMDVLNQGGVIIDSGTTYTYFPSEVYDAIFKSLNDSCNKNTSYCGGPTAATDAEGFCWEYFEVLHGDLEGFFSTFPTINFYFGVTGDAKYEWKGGDYLTKAPGTDNIYCLGMKSSEWGTILGATFMKNHDIIFDKDNSRIGFVGANCEPWSSVL